MYKTDKISLLHDGLWNKKAKKIKKQEGPLFSNLLVAVYFISVHKRELRSRTAMFSFTPVAFGYL